MDQDNIKYHAIHSCVPEVEPGVLRVLIRDEETFKDSTYFFLKALQQDVLFDVHFGRSVQIFVPPARSQKTVTAVHTYCSAEQR